MKRFINDVRQYYKYVFYAARSELRAEVANSYLNWLWWIIEPICFMFIYVLVFGVFFASKVENINVFVFTGITMWDFFSHMLTSSVKLIKNNKAIVAKVYLPKYMLLFVKILVNLFKMGISFVILFGMAIATGISITWNTLWVLPIVATMVVFTFAICTFLLHFGVYVEDLANVVRILLRIVFYLTGIFYDLEQRVTAIYGHKVAMMILHGNPMASVLSAARKAIIYGQRPELKYLALWFVLGVIFSVFGIRLIYKNENNYVKVI